MPLHLWDTTAGLVVEEQLHGRRCFAGLDLASTTDLASWVLLFPPLAAGDPFDVIWRFWTPEAQIAFLDSHTGGQASVWVRQGQLAVTEGDWIDYAGAIHPKIEADSKNFRIVTVGYDQKEATATAQFMQGLGLEITPVYQGYGLSQSLKELMRLVKAVQLCHGGHPVARWNADSAEIRQDDQERIKLVKPVRGASGKRIDGIAALANSIWVAQHHEAAAAEPSMLVSF
jgi:phage terminase large subunit-like protein